MANFESSAKYFSFHKLGINRGSPRVWLESRRLEALGFGVGVKYEVMTFPRGVRINVAESGRRRVSKRRAAGGVRPIIDLASLSTIGSLAQWDEVKVTACQQKIEISPSIRAFAIRRQRAACPPWRTLEIFCGGGTLSSVVSGHRDFKLVTGLEIDARYADVWQSTHRDALLVQADIRLVHPSEYPPFDILIAGIPCTSHSMLGRAKKSLRGKPELGESGDLFLSVATLVATRLPLACVFENVPSFRTSLAGQTLAQHLLRLGYEITQTILDPHAQWGEPQDRRRWLMIATLQRGFRLQIPESPFSGTLNEILDSPDESDEADALRIHGSIEALKKHQQRHKALGHGFRFSTINRDSRRVPTIVRSYHKINVGPFVETKFGPRLLRKHEIESLMGCHIDCDHYATAVEILGQGVQAGVFRRVLSQVSDFLKLHLLKDTTSAQAPRITVDSAP